MGNDGKDPRKRPAEDPSEEPSATAEPVDDGTRLLKTFTTIFSFDNRKHKKARTEEKDIRDDKGKLKRFMGTLLVNGVALTLGRADFVLQKEKNGYEFGEGDIAKYEENYGTRFSGMNFRDFWNDHGEGKLIYDISFIPRKDDLEEYGLAFPNVTLEDGTVVTPDRVWATSIHNSMAGLSTWRNTRASDVFDSAVFGPMWMCFGYIPEGKLHWIEIPMTVAQAEEVFETFAKYQAAKAAAKAAYQAAKAEAEAKKAE